MKITKDKREVLNEHLSILACRALADKARGYGLHCSVKEWWYVNEAEVGRASLDDMGDSTVDAPAFTVLEAMALLTRMGCYLNIGSAQHISDETVKWYWQECDGPNWQNAFDTPSEAIEDALRCFEIMETNDATN